MMRHDLTFGVEAESLESVADELAIDFGLAFEARYSDYLGGLYYLAKKGNEEIRIQSNKDGDELAESEFPDANVLVEIDALVEMEPWKVWAKSRGAVLIRENVY